MLRFLRKSVFPSNMTRLYFNSNRIIQPHFENRLSKPGIHSHAAFFVKPTSQKKYGRPFSFTNILRFQHNELIQSEMLGYIRKFEDILTSIEENQNDLSVDTIRSYISQINSLLDDLAFEEHHGTRLIENKSFSILFQAIDNSMDQMSSNDFTSILNLCKELHIPLNSRICFKMIKRLKDSFERMDFNCKVEFWFALSKLIVKLENKTVIQRLIDDVGKMILNDVKRGTYLTSSESLGLALSFMNFYYFVPKGAQTALLSAVLDLENWDNANFFKYFLKEKDFQENQKHLTTLNVEYLERMRQEVMSKNNAFSHYFLRSYAIAVATDLADYDQTLVDDIINKMLAGRLNATQIHIAIHALARMKHSHFGFTDYLVEYLKRNTYIYVSHPDFSARILKYIFYNNNFYHDRSGLATVQSLIRDNPNVFNLLKSINKRGVLDYIRAVSNFAVLEIFIDKELDYLNSYFMKKRKLITLPPLFMLFVLNMNQAVKIFHPDYPKSLLSDSTVSDALSKFWGKISITSELLTDVKEHLEKASGVSNSVLETHTNKLGFTFDGFVAVNNQGQFYDFGLQHNDQDAVNYLEDIVLPTGFELISLLMVSESAHARNALHLKPSTLLRLKISERLGFPTVLVYQSIFKRLNNDEKGNYLLKMILEKVPKKDKAENFST